jgi:Tol biopolymer transport system component
MGQIADVPAIYPDDMETTIPYNIAPLNFALTRPAKQAVSLFKSEDMTFEVIASGGQFTIPSKKWKALLQSAAGQSIEVRVQVKEEAGWKSYMPFRIYVAAEPVDAYLAYRLIEPGYELWNQMGIYQRNLETYDQSAIYENKLTGYNCVNCHSFCMQNPDSMLFHLRASYGGTMLIRGDEIERLDTKTDQTLASFTYPYWHPSGKYVAFSVNNVAQDFHPTQQVEVFDYASDVVVYDVEGKQALIPRLTASSDRFETFPSFSPDGKTLFYCSAPACPMPDSVGQLMYSLFALSFDAETQSFGNRIDTLFDAGVMGRSVSFPRVSPDGKYLMCTLSAYGTFPVWHKDADLYILNLATGEGYFPEKANSEYTESYHSWSSNSRWVVFSSRRLDGLYTRPFLTYIDTGGRASKPFVLPQKQTSFYLDLMKSYNIPEFVTGPVKDRSWQLRKKARGADIQKIRAERK